MTEPDPDADTCRTRSSVKTPRRAYDFSTTAEHPELAPADNEPITHMDIRVQPAPELAAVVPGPEGTPPVTEATGDDFDDGAQAEGPGVVPVVMHTDPDMEVPLVPPGDITPEQALVLFPTPLYLNEFPLNRPPSGS